MKHLILFSTLCLTLSARADDIRKYIDPWGKRLNAIELQQRKGEVEAETRQRRLQLINAQIEHDDVLKKLTLQRGRIEQVRTALKRILAQEDSRLTDLVQRQKNQTEYSEKVLASATSLQISLQAISQNILTLKSHAEVAQILTPVLTNTPENRELWTEALKQIELKTDASAQTRASAARLREKVQNSNDWIWRRPADLMSGYVGILEQFNSNVTQASMENLLLAAQQMAAHLNAQYEIQKSLLETMLKLKQTHDSMSGDLN